MHIFPQRASLQELGGEILKLVSYSATPEQWAEWLRVPLEHAAARGNLGLVDALLEAGADGSARWRGCRGRTLLDAAAVGGNQDVVTALLQAGAEPDVNVVSMSLKRSALYVATVCGHEEAARRLIQAGVDVRFEDPVDRCSVLHKAAHDGHELLVNDLLVGGADPSCLVGDYGTPLHAAASSGHGGIVSALLLRGADKDANDRDGFTPLMWAAKDGRLAAVEILLAADADVEVRNNFESSALDLAASTAHIPVLQAVLGHGADVNSLDDSLRSALHIAAVSNQPDAIDALVDAGADIDLEANEGDTPLFQASFESCSESMLALLKRGANVMSCDEFAYSPLHQACLGKRSGLEVAVDLLLRWGADETVWNEDGQPPADLLNRLPDDGENRCSQEEVERVRLLLARAPADRAWRRRGWLVLLRSRSLKVGVAGHGNAADDGNGRACTSVPGRRGEGGKTARNEAATEAGVEEHGAREHTSSGGAESGGLLGVGPGGGAEDSGVGFSGIVARLLGLEVEGVFRNVVVFL